ncbi:MAG: response regulator [Candidatus Omnitrophica bacterium]|nr:response regulator [Candidatus Omnitrophota bacterium]
MNGAVKILIVEDTAADLEALRQKLAGTGYELLAETDGCRGIARAEEASPDLIILDLLLPDIDGFEVCRRLKKNPRFDDVPILFYTSVRSIDEKLIGLQLGAADFLTKDAPVRELLVRIQNLLAERRARSERLRQAVLDARTSIYHRDYFLCRLAEECARGKRHRSFFCCAILAVDGGSAWPERFGPEIAEGAMQELAVELRAAGRQADTVACFGAGAFAWLFIESPAEEAAAHFERVRLRVSSHRFAFFQALQATVSIGISMFDVGMPPADELLRRAESMCAAAAAAGGNRIKIYQQGVAQ